MTPPEENHRNVSRGGGDPRDSERFEALEDRLDELGQVDRASASDEVGARIAARSYESLRTSPQEPGALARIGGAWRIAAGLLIAGSAVALIGVLDRGAAPSSPPVAELPPDEALETWVVDVAAWEEMDFESAQGIDDAIGLTNDAFSSWSDDITLFEETL